MLASGSSLDLNKDIHLIRQHITNIRFSYLRSHIPKTEEIHSNKVNAGAELKQDLH